LIFFSFGAVGATLISLAAQRLASLWLTPATVSYTVGPVVEELAQTLPVIIIALVLRDGRRLSVADLAMIGFTSGIGFGFVEANLRALAAGRIPEYVTSLSYLTPGVRVAGAGAFGAGHGIWIGLVGLAAGVGVRIWPRGRLAWIPVVIALALVTFDHAMLNWRLLHPRGDAGVTGLVQQFTLQGRIEVLLLPLGLLLAEWLEGRRSARALGPATDLMLEGEGPRPRVIVEWWLALKAARHGLRRLRQTLGYFRVRRSYALALEDAAHVPADKEAQEYAKAAKERVDRERLLGAFALGGSRLPASKVALSLLGRFGWPMGFGLVVVLLFAVGPKVLPHDWQPYLKSRGTAAVIALAAVAYTTWRVARILRSKRPKWNADDGEALTTFHGAALVISGSLTAGVIAALASLLPPEWLFAGGSGVLATHSHFVSGAAHNFDKAGGNPSGAMGAGAGAGAAAAGATAPADIAPVTKDTTAAIPPGPATKHYATGVDIHGTPEFVTQTVQNLDTIRGTDVGKQLLQHMADSGNTTTLQESPSITKDGTGYTNPGDRFQKADGTPGKGTSANITIYPKAGTLYGGTEPWHTYPPDVALFHEMTHANQAMHGTTVDGTGTNPGGHGTANLRELQTSGLGPYAKDPITENAYRGARGLPLRTYY
jgi:hypothetical protein